MIDQHACAGAILSGGQSRRMGQPKALLPLGNETFLTRLTAVLAPFEERYLSANDLSLGRNFPGTVVPDQLPGAGPLAGLQAVLSAMKKDFMLCVPCDMINVNDTLITRMLAAFQPEDDALLCLGAEDGRVCPLCAIYARRVLPTVEAQLRRDHRRVMELVALLRCTQLPVEDALLLNVNRPEDYQILLARRERCGYVEIPQLNRP